uniref:Integrase catalytic domain-containing protein n=1 Tax=Strigamia maritima TaxID=126957 RepID=T1IQ63_STRMM
MMRTKKLTDSKAEKLLRTVYYDPGSPAGFAGASRLKLAVRNRGVSDEQIRRFLENSETFTLHRPTRRKFVRNRTVTSSINSKMQADLVEIGSLSKYNDNMRFIITAIDVLSRKAYAEPISAKSSKVVLEGFDKILKRVTGPKIQKLQTDHGSEWFNKDFQQYLKQRIHHFATENFDTKSTIVERFNREIQSKIHKWITFTGQNRFVDKLDDFLHSYNTAVHRSIKMAPNEVNRTNEKEVWHILYGDDGGKKRKFKYALGDHVRISKERAVFTKGCKPGWSVEIF